MRFRKAPPTADAAKEHKENQPEPKVAVNPSQCFHFMWFPSPILKIYLSAPQDPSQDDAKVDRMTMWLRGVESEYSLRGTRRRFIQSYSISQRSSKTPVRISRRKLVLVSYQLLFRRRRRGLRLALAWTRRIPSSFPIPVHLLLRPLSWPMPTRLRLGQDEQLLRPSSLRSRLVRSWNGVEVRMRTYRERLAPSLSYNQS